MSGVWGVVLVALVVVVLGAEATYLPGFKVDHNSRPVWVPPPSPFPVHVPNVDTDCVVQHCQLANTTDDCSKLCNCGWDATANECACTEPDMPACESSYPAPSVTNLQRLAKLAPSLFFPNDSISVFGDSITWLNGYLPLIESVFQTAGVPLKVTNRGINGAKIKDLVTGGQGWDPYVNTIQEDNATFVAIYIGINDVWFPSGTYSPPDQFYATLTNMVKQANAFTKNKAVLATVSVIGEAINGGSSFTNQLEVYANLTRAVAAATGSPVADLRAEFMAYLNKYNVPFPPRHPNGLDSGVLTIDGVHPCHGGCASHSNYLIANSLAGALITAAQARAL